MAAYSPVIAVLWMASITRRGESLFSIHHLEHRSNAECVCVCVRVCVLVCVRVCVCACMCVGVAGCESCQLMLGVRETDEPRVCETLTLGERSPCLAANSSILTLWHLPTPLNHDIQQSLN